MDTDFSTLLRTYRKSMGWTQEEISQKWSYSFETISAWERRKRNLGSQEIPQLAKYLGIEPEKLAAIILRSHVSRENPVLLTYEAGGVHIYRTRTEFNKDFSYPKMFETCHSILAVGISLNAIVMNYDRELLKQAILERDCFLQFCFLDPSGKQMRAWEEEEGYEPDVLTRLTDTNIFLISSLRSQIAKVDSEKGKFLEIRTYNLIPRFNIYIVDDMLMTVQGYAYGRGEETPIFFISRKTRGGLFDFYSSIAQHVLEHSKEVSSKDIGDHRDGL